MILPKISILTPTFNRRRFLPLMISNIHRFDYPKELIEWNILDSLGFSGEKGPKLFKNDSEVQDLQSNLNIIINYRYLEEPLQIGEKRNILSQNSNHDILINMDDDDVYFNSYLKHSIITLLNTKKDIVGCLDMLFIYPEKDFQISYIQCVKNYILYDESTLCMKKSHWEKYKYVNTSKGEGNTIYGNQGLCGKTNIFQCLICSCWKENTINKDYFLKYPIQLSIDKNISNILQISFSKNVFISKQILKNIKSLLQSIYSKTNDIYIYLILIIIDVYLR